MARQRSGELREYHESPPTLVRDMEEWLDVGDRREAAERVRQWVIESYELAPLAKASPTRSRPRAATGGGSSNATGPKSRTRRVSRGSSSR